MVNTVGRQQVCFGTSGAAPSATTCRYHPGTAEVEIGIFLMKLAYDLKKIP